jgi:cell cycle sensor histidine kinase DivJ
VNDSVPTAEAPFDGPARGAARPSPETAWQVGWAAGAGALAALMLATLENVPASILLAFALMAGLGLLGGVWRPKQEERIALLALWALTAVLATCITGGIGGPLAVLCLTPLIAGAALGAPWREGAGLSAASLIVCALLSRLHLAPAPAGEPIRSWTVLAALLLLIVALAGALAVARRRAQARAEETEAEVAELQALLGDLPDLALLTDMDGRTTVVFGQPIAGLDEAALHQGLFALAAPADHARLTAALAEAATAGAAETTFLAAGDAALRIAATFRTTSVGGVLAVLRPAPLPVAQPALAPRPAPETADLAARLAAAEAARQEAEAGRSKAEAEADARARFLANMSHELRTPLNAIMGFSDVMRLRMFGELSPKYAEYAGLIHESGGHLMDLINDVLDMSKIEARRYELSTSVFDVREALNAALRLIRLQADEAGVKLRAVLPPDPLMVDADKRAIKQIALNLLSNAVKFTPKDGVVILTAQAADGCFELVVADTGMGIAEADLKRLGQPFEQAGEAGDRARGTGLGLSLVGALARLHGGTMTLESRLGEGTAVTVRAPVLAAEPEAAPERQMDEPQRHEPQGGEPQTLEPHPQDLPAEALTADPEPSPTLEPEPPAEIHPEAIAEAEPAIPETSPTPPTVAEAPSPTPAPLGLGPLENRRGEHGEFRRQVLDIFSRKPIAFGGPE